MPDGHLPTIVFLDRDGTLIRDVHYLSRPEQVELLPGAGEAIAHLNRVRIPVILITNQSGIARGYFTVADYERAHGRLVALLAAQGAHLDASYYCPHYPSVSGPCSCRKPSALLFHQAITEHHLDPSRPVFIGDRWRDLAPFHELGGRGLLIPSPDTPAGEITLARAEATIYPTLTIAISALLDSPHSAG